MDATVNIRPAGPADAAGVRRVVAQAFEREAEADLVDLLVERKQDLIGLVATLGDEVVGHVLVSPIALAAPGKFGGVAPLSVLPSVQGQGIGGKLMRAAIEAARALGFDALFLLGNPRYYSRFGFVTAPVGNEYGQKEAFQSLELTHGCLDGVNAVARYVDAFAEVDT